MALTGGGGGVSSPLRGRGGRRFGVDGQRDGSGHRGRRRGGQHGRGQERVVDLPLGGAVGLRKRKEGSQETYSGAMSGSDRIFSRFWSLTSRTGYWSDPTDGSVDPIRSRYRLI